MRKILGSVAVLLALAVVAAMPASAGWRDDLKVLRIGTVAPHGAAYDIARLEPFRAYMQDRLGLPVEIVAMADYDALIDAQTSARVQYAIHSASSYATTEALCACVEPIALPAAFDGSHGFHSVLVAHAGSAIASLADARGKRLALTGADSIAGRLVPLKALAGEGIDPKTYFSSLLHGRQPRTGRDHAVHRRGRSRRRLVEPRRRRRQRLQLRRLHPHGIGGGVGDGPPQDRLEIAADPLRTARRAARPAGRAEDPDRGRPHGDGGAKRPMRSTRSTHPTSVAAASCRPLPPIIR